MRDYNIWNPIPKEQKPKRIQDERTCKKCSTTLSQYTKGNICNPCKNKGLSVVNLHSMPYPKIIKRRWSATE